MRVPVAVLGLLLGILGMGLLGAGCGLDGGGTGGGGGGGGSTGGWGGGGGSSGGGGGGSSGGGGAKTYTCTVNASGSWASCGGATVQTGGTITVSATGRWSTVDSGLTCGPEGYDANPSSWGDYRENTNFRWGALLWRVITAPNYSGSVGTYTATATGGLEVQVNDTGLGNNTGSVNVTVTVQ